MDILTLKAEVREIAGRRVKHLRREGLIPAVLYGRDQEATLLQINQKSLGKVLSEAGTHQLISLEIDGGKPKMSLARDIQRDYIRRNYLHVDFYAVKMDEKVTAQVPLIVEGVSPAVEFGGVLTHGLDALEIECLPADLISGVAVDISGLEEFNDSLFVTDLKVPKSVTILSDPESMIVKIEAPRKMEEAIVGDAEASAALEAEEAAAAEAADEEL